MNEPSENTSAVNFEGPDVTQSCTHEEIYGRPVRVYKKANSEDLTREESECLVPVQAVQMEAYQIVTYEQFVVASALYHMGEFTSIGQKSLPLPTIKVPAYFVDVGRRAYLWQKEDRIEYLNYVEYLIKHFAHTNFARAMWILWVGWMAHLMSEPRIKGQLHYMISRNQSQFVGKLYPSLLQMHWSHWMNTQHYHRFPLHQTVKLLPTTMGLQYVFKSNGLLHLQRIYLGQQASWNVASKNQSINASQRRYWAMLFPHMHELFSGRTVAKKANVLRRRQVSWRVKRYAIRNRVTRRAHHWHTCFHFVDVLPQRLDGLFQLAPQIRTQMRIRKKMYRKVERRLKRGRRFGGMSKTKWASLKLWARLHSSGLYAPGRYKFRYYPHYEIVPHVALGGNTLVLPFKNQCDGIKNALSRRNQGLQNALARTFAPYSLRRKWHYRVHNPVCMYGHLIKYIGGSTSRPASQNMRSWFTFPDQYWAAENLRHNQETPPDTQPSITHTVEPGEESWAENKMNRIAWLLKIQPELRAFNPEVRLDPDEASRTIGTPDLSERSLGGDATKNQVDNVNDPMYHRRNDYETSANRMMIAWCWDLYSHTPHNLRHMKGQFVSVNQKSKPKLGGRHEYRMKKTYGVDFMRDVYPPTFWPGEVSKTETKVVGQNLRYKPHHRFKMGVKWDPLGVYGLFDTVQRRIFMELQNNLPVVARFEPTPTMDHDATAQGKLGKRSKGAIGSHVVRNDDRLPYVNTQWWRNDTLKTMTMRTANWVLSRPNRQPLYTVASCYRPGLYGPRWSQGLNPKVKGLKPHKILRRMRARQRLVLGQSDMLKRQSTSHMWPNMTHDQSRHLFRPAWTNPYHARSWEHQKLTLLLSTPPENLHKNCMLMQRATSLYSGFELVRRMNWGHPYRPEGFYSGVQGDEEGILFDHYDRKNLIRADYMQDWRYSDVHEESPDKASGKPLANVSFQSRSASRCYGYRHTARPGLIASYIDQEGPLFMGLDDQPAVTFSGFERSWDPSRWGGETPTAFNMPDGDLKDYPADHGLYGYGPSVWFPEANAEPAEETEVSPGVYVAPGSKLGTFQFGTWDSSTLITPDRDHMSIYTGPGKIDRLIAPHRTALRKSTVWENKDKHDIQNRYWGARQQQFTAYQTERRLYHCIMWTFVFVCGRMMHVYAHRRRFTLWRIFNEFILRCRYFAFDSMFSMHRTVRPIPKFGMEKWVDTARLWTTLRYTLLYLHEERKKRINRLLDIRLKPLFDPPNLFHDAPRGFMVIGPPGTGKTLLVKAFAGEARVPILVYGTEYYFPFYDLGAYEDDEETVDVYFEDGQLESERQLRNLFHAARHFSPCVVFIDEIDGVAAARDLKQDPPILHGFYGDRGFGCDRVLEPNRAFGTWTTRGDHARRLNAVDRTPWEVTNITLRNTGFLRNHAGVMTRQYPSSRLSYDNKPREHGLIYNNDLTLIRLLNELDGIMSSQETRDFVVFGATNRPWMLDKALLRPGRLNTVLYLDLPSEQKRFELIQLFVGNQHVESIDWNRFSKRTIGFEPASLEAMVNFSRLRSLLLCKQQGQRLKVNHTNRTLDYGRNTQSYNISTVDVRVHMGQLESLLSPPQPYALGADANGAASEARFEAKNINLVLEKSISPSVLTSVYASGGVIIISPEACPTSVKPEANVCARAESLMTCRWALQKKHHVPQGYGAALQKKMQLYVDDLKLTGFKRPWLGLIYGWRALDEVTSASSPVSSDVRSVLNRLVPETHVNIWVLALRAAQRLQADMDPVWSILLEPTVFGADRRFGYDIQRLFYSAGPHVTPSRLAVLKPCPTFYTFQDVCGELAHGKKGTPWNSNWGNALQRANWHQLNTYGKEAFFVRSAYYNASRVLIRYFLPKRNGYPNYDLYETCQNAHLSTDVEKWIFGLYQACNSQADFEYMLLDLLSGKVGEQFFYFKRCTNPLEVHEHKTTLGLEHTRQVNWLMEIMLEHNLFYDAKHDLKRKTYIEQYDGYRGPQVQSDYPEKLDEDIPGRELAASEYEWFPKDTESSMYVHGNRTYIPFHFDSLVSVTHAATRDFMGEIYGYDDYGADQWFTQRHHVFHMKAYRTEKKFPPIQFEWQRVGLNHNIEVDLSTLESWHILNVPCENQIPWNAHWNRLPKAEQDIKRAGALRHAYEKLCKVLDENQDLLDHLSRVFLRFQAVDERQLFHVIHQWIQPRLNELTILPDSEMDEIRRMYSEKCYENPARPPLGQDVEELWGPVASSMPTGADVSGPDTSPGTDVNDSDASQ